MNDKKIPFLPIVNFVFNIFKFCLIINQQQIIIQKVKRNQICLYVNFDQIKRFQKFGTKYKRKSLILGNNKIKIGNFVSFKYEAKTFTK